MWCPRAAPGNPCPRNHTMRSSAREIAQPRTTWRRHDHPSRAATPRAKSPPWKLVDSVMLETLSTDPSRTGVVGSSPATLHMRGTFSGDQRCWWRTRGNGSPLCNAPILTANWRIRCSAAHVSLSLLFSGCGFQRKPEKVVDRVVRQRRWDSGSEHTVPEAWAAGAVRTLHRARLGVV